MSSCSIKDCSNDFASSEGYVSSGKADLYYKTIGEGDPVFIVHGGPGLDQTYLQPQLNRLAKNNKLIFFDQRGAGKSFQKDISYGDITINQLVDDMEVIRKDLNLDKITIMGHSWGGFLSMRYAIKHPKNVKKLLLFNSLPANHEGQQAFVNRFMENNKGIMNDIKAIFSYDEFKKLSVSEINALYRSVFTGYFYKPSNVEKLSLSFAQDPARSGFKVNQEIAKETLALKTVDLFPELKKLNMPVLIIYGRDDIVPAWTGEKLNKAIKNSKLAIIENSSHFPYIENEKEFFKIVEGFLKSE